MAQTVKNMPAMWESRVWSLVWEGPLEKGIATHFSILAWRIPRTEEPGELQSMESQRVGRDWVTECVRMHTHTHTHTQSSNWQIYVLRLWGHTLRYRVIPLSHSPSILLKLWSCWGMENVSSTIQKIQISCLLHSKMTEWSLFVSKAYHSISL